MRHTRVSGDVSGQGAGPHVGEGFTGFLFLLQLSRPRTPRAPMPSCPTCGRSFGSDVSLLQHLESTQCLGGSKKVHGGIEKWEKHRKQQPFTNGRRPQGGDLIADEGAWDDYCEQYLCALCDRGFAQLHHLNQHLRSGVHDDATYECRQCGRAFPRAHQLFQHVRAGGPCAAGNTARLGRVMVGDFQALQGGPKLIGAGPNLRPEATLRFDGAARPNPGYGGFGYCIEDDLGVEIKYGVGFPANPEDFHCTSNEAEYLGLIAGLKAAYRECGIRRLQVCGDSELVIRQMTGEYAVHSYNLQPLKDAAVKAAKKFLSVSYTHVSRKKNKRADALAEKGVVQAKKFFGHYLYSDSDSSFSGYDS